MRKVQLNVKVDKNLEKAAKNHNRELKMIDNEDINANNREENIIEKYKKNINFLITNTFLDTFAIMSIC